MTAGAVDGASGLADNAGMSLTRTYALFLAGALGIQLSPALCAAPVDAAALYAAKCALCHGKDGVPLPPMAAQKVPSFADERWQASKTDADIQKAIEVGKPGTLMRGFKSDFNAEQLAALVAHVRSLKAAPKK